MRENAPRPNRHLGRLVAPLFLFGMIGIVLIAHGFWGAQDRPPVPHALGAEATDGTAQTAPTPEGDTVPVVVSVPGGNAVTVLHDSVESPLFSGYVHRPAASITVPGQRITLVSARRDDTTTTIANRTGVTTTAVQT